ncbi:MAG: ATP-binding protein, partial [Saprospiraceae bacterium]
ICWQLYQDLIQPISLLMTGAEAIKDQDFNIKFLKTGKYEMDKLIEVYNLMIDHLRDERTRQEAQHFFLDKLIETSPTGIIILNHDDIIVSMNAKAHEIISKFDQASWKKEVFPSGMSKTISLNGVETYKVQKSHFTERGFPRHFIMIEELSKEILSAEKNAYGKIIRMMAHEVNNSIGAINSILDSTLQVQEKEDYKNALQIAIWRNDHLNLFMRNFADLVRLPSPQKETLDVGSLIHSSVSLMQFKAKEKNISILLKLPDYPVYINADKQQMEQVFINILKNAIESFGFKENAVIQVCLRETPLKILFENNGSDIPKHIEIQLFTPFFSTKKNGQGIGLTLIREILVNHQLGFSLKTIEPGRTRFEIIF